MGRTTPITIEPTERDAASRRALGRPVPDEVRRDVLIDRLAERWNVKLVTVTAPGGYGKSTALAQAIRDNDTDPSGIDVYVRCRPSHLTVDELVRDVLRAWPGGEPRLDGPPTVDLVITAMAHESPNDVCLHLDDVHHLDAIDGAAEVLDRLVRELPFNGHLVLAGRSMPEVRLTRLQAADAIVELGPADLGFDADELATLAGSHGVDAGALAHVGGWPALARLALVTGHESTRDFLMEEVVGELDPATRTAIAVALVAGSADDALLAACGLATTTLELLRTAPLLIDYGDGVVGAHDLWSDVRDALVDDDRLAAIAEIVVGRRLAAGDNVDAVEIAIRGRSWSQARRAMLAVLDDGDTHLSLPSVRAWLAALPASEHDEAEVQLVRGISARLAGDPAAGLDDVIAAGEEFRRRGHVDAETVVCTELGTRSWLLARSDLRRGLDEWADDIIERGGLRMRDESLTGRAAAADLRGDSARALALYQQVRDPGELQLRHMSTLSMRLGDPELAESYIAQLDRLVGHPVAAGHVIGMRWMAGDPNPALAAGAGRPARLGNRRNEFTAAAHAALIGASLGVPPDAEAVGEMVWERNREQAFLAVVRAAAGLLGAGEAQAANEFRRRTEELGLDDPLVRGEALRFLPYAYLLSPELQEWIDHEATLGPLHERMRELAAALCDARRQPGTTIGPLPTPAETLTWLPLPWSLELAARLTDADDDRGRELATYLADTCGATVLGGLRRLRRTTPELAASIDTIVAAIPLPPDVTTHVAVCGEVAVRHGGAGAPVTRLRVRQLLELLVLRGEIRRDVAIDALWPDADTATGRSNLRVTLTHLRKLLLPSHRGGEAHFHLRQRDDVIWLHRSDRLVVDAWQITSALRRGASAESRRRSRASRADAEALATFSAPAFPALRDDPRFTPEIEAFEQAVVRAGCSIAEQHLAAGDLDEALAAAEHVIELDPYAERAHDVAIGVHLGRGDLDGAQQAIDRCLTGLRELGVAPSSGTEMLIRRHRRRTTPTT